MQSCCRLVVYFVLLIGQELLTSVFLSPLHRLPGDRHNGSCASGLRFIANHVSARCVMKKQDE